MITKQMPRNNIDNGRLSANMVVYSGPTHSFTDNQCLTEQVLQSIGLYTAAFRLQWYYHLELYHGVAIHTHIRVVSVNILLASQTERADSPWASCRILKTAGCACAGNAGNVFHRQRGLAIPTCITARAWRTCHDACRDRWLAVSFEVDGGENVPDIPGACATLNLTYLVRGPWIVAFNNDFYKNILVRFLTSGRHHNGHRDLARLNCTSLKHENTFLPWQHLHAKLTSGKCCLLKQGEQPILRGMNKKLRPNKMAGILHTTFLNAFHWKKNRF